MKIYRRFRKNISLRIVNLVGLSVVFACLLLSTGYIKRELSFDRHHIGEILRIEHGTIFALAGLFVLFVSVVSVSLQSWHAATSNPVKAIKTE